MSYCAGCAALQRQNDFLANDRDGYVQLLTDENNKLRAEVEKLRNLRAEVKRLRAALEWYASSEAWTVSEVEGPDGDYGKRARAALEEKQ